ncbi:MAG: tyrosine-protein phosphatase [Phycisphaerae bacterium]|nr:tyrosine-protein phosphatase [Phycisphaerae bacterium]
MTDTKTDTHADTPQPRPRWRKHVIRAAVIAPIVTAIVFYIGVKDRWFKPPYPETGKAICWLIGGQEEAYNFGKVVPGKVYRSARPDERLYRYVADTYGVRQVVRLCGPEDTDVIPLPPDDLNMDVTIVSWESSIIPPRDELRRVLSVLDDETPALVHCSAGVHRTGFAVGAYRVLRQGWSAERAREEMQRYSWNDLSENDLYIHLGKLARMRDGAAHASR